MRQLPCVASCPWYCDRVAGHQIRAAHAQIEARRHDVNKPPLGEDVDMNLRIELQIAQDQRRHYLTRGGREGIDAQDAGRRLLLGARRIHRFLDALERWFDLCDEDPTRIGERDATRGAIEQSDVKLPLELAHRAADGRGRHAEIERRRSKRTAPSDRENRFKFDERMARHCPDFRNTSRRFILLIRRKVHR